MCLCSSFFILKNQNILRAIINLFYKPKISQRSRIFFTKTRPFARNFQRDSQSRLAKRHRHIG